MKFMRGVLTLGILIVAIWWPAIQLSADDSITPPQPQADLVYTDIVPFVKKYCLACHNAVDPQSGLDLSSFRDEISLLKHRQSWQNVQRMVRAAEMPPKEKLQPANDEREKFLGIIDTVINKVDCGKEIDPGRVTIRRLNRVEYNNTIHDLTGVQIHPADDFPADDIGYGFDHIGDVLSLPPVLFEKYLAAAEKIVDAALRDGEITNGPIRRFPSREMTWIGPGEAPNKGIYGRMLSVGGELRSELENANDAEFVANVRAFVIPKCRQPFQLELRIDGMPRTVLEFVDVKTKTHLIRVRIPRGRHSISVALIGEGAEPIEPPPPLKDATGKLVTEEWPVPRLIFEYIDMQGPIDDSPTLSEQLIFTCRPKSDGSDESICVDQILGQFVCRAFRRPVTAVDVHPYVALFQRRRTAGDSLVASLKAAISAVLISPQFLFRIERDPDSEQPFATRDLNDFELATRLSYFLWSTMPDDELTDAARKRQLRQPTVLRDQIRRMLNDPRRQMLVGNFAGQWLQLRNLEILNPDRNTFPDFDTSLRLAMRRETELFFEHLIHEDRSILELLDADYTFANAQLAKHYGLTGIDSDRFQKVNFTNDQRGGILTQASILTVTSNPTRTSPVKRGKWVLENILGAPPPPPPPMVEPLDESATATAKGSLRERMEQHRSKAGCAACHQRMDPLGFGFENFDGIGRWRTMDGEFPVDPAGDLPSGESFKTPKQLRSILLAHRDEFARCLTEKMLTYALGRGLEYYDKCAIDIITNRLRQGDYRFSVLIQAIVESDPFQRKRTTKDQSP
jgi:hypothetical protein